MVTTAWSDLNKDGRRLESLLKEMNTKFWKADNDLMQLAYVDRIIKATHEKVAIANSVLAVKQLLKGETVEYEKSFYTR